MDLQRGQFPWIYSPLQHLFSSQYRNGLGGEETKSVDSFLFVAEVDYEAGACEEE